MYVYLLLLRCIYQYGCTCTVVSSSIATHPIDTTAAAPYSAVFTCSIYGYGYQNITWHREANKLPYNHQIKEISSPRIITTTLIIPNVTEQDVGKYYCQVWANNMRAQSDRANLYYAGNVLFYENCNIDVKLNLLDYGMPKDSQLGVV